MCGGGGSTKNIAERQIIKHIWRLKTKAYKAAHPQEFVEFRHIEVVRLYHVKIRVVSYIHSRNDLRKYLRLSSHKLLWFHQWSLVPYPARSLEHWVSTRWMQAILKRASYLHSSFARWQYGFYRYYGPCAPKLKDNEHRYMQSRNAKNQQEAYRYRVSGKYHNILQKQ